MTSPLTKKGYLVYVVDTGVEEYQVWNGSSWITVGRPDTNFLNSDLTGGTNRAHDFDGASQTWNDVGGFNVNATGPGSIVLSHVDSNVTVKSDGVSLAIGAADDLRINGSTGAAGQVITSQGSDLPPVWATPATLFESTTARLPMSPTI